MSPFDPGEQEQTASASTACAPSVEYRLQRDRGRVVRTVLTNAWTRSSSVRLESGAPLGDAESVFDWCWLRQRVAPQPSRPAGVLRAVDLFSGCGQMSVGAREAARAMRLAMDLVLAHDLNSDATKVCSRVFPGCKAITGRIEDCIDGPLGARSTPNERRLVRELGDVDLLMGGPPCQGHSDLNNHTRRDDPRNSLALRMARFAELVRPRFVLLENVKGIVHDRKRVIHAVDSELQRLGYRTARALIRAEDHGVPQRRHRMFMVATLNNCDPTAILQLPLRRRRDFSWACHDLDGIVPSNEYDRPPIATPANQRRMDFLLRKDKWDLPNSQRPPCHRDGNHTYNSIYGRLWWDRPAQTITTGFRCMGQGRYVHPRHPRTISAHEAARLQFIPDFVNFDGILPTSVARLIGNAVPPKLVYEVVLRMLASCR